MKCPCNPYRLYENCCAKAHQDILQVSTAEELMRSRYSAFVMGNVPYLQDTHHSSGSPDKKEARQIEKWTNSVNWVKLVILQTTEGLENDITGTVEFKAFYMENNKVQVIHENSRFCKENGHWVYLDALD